MLEVKPDKLAFTANALVHGIQLMGYDLFDLVPKYGKFYVSEFALIKHPEINNVSFSCIAPMVLKDQWFNLRELPYEQEDELQRLFLFANNNPSDDLTIVVDTLNEFGYLNRVLGQDQLITVYDLKKLF